MFSRHYAIYCSLCLALTLHGCKQVSTHTYTFQKTAFANEGMIVSAHPLATKAGLDMLNDGGNAVDAAIAVHLALAVVYPRAGNIGGGGFMIYRSADGEYAALDYREKAPMAAHRDMFLDSSDNAIPGLSQDGPLAVGVPGTIAGLEEAHKKYGSLPWKKLFDPAIQLARKGHPITTFEAERLNLFRDSFIKFNGSEIPFVKDSVWYAGDLLIQRTLGETLKRIAVHGCDEFYRGETAVRIVDEMQQGGGIITPEDLASYRPVWRNPVVTEYKGYTVISMPPPSSGGIHLLQLLEITEQYPLRAWGPRNLRTIHLMAEAERRVFADRATHLGDTDFYPVPLDSLMASEYLQSRMADFSPDTVTPSVHVTAGDFELVIESYETTHFSVVDRDGNAVSMTTTLNTNFGSKVFVDGGGFFLNNQMDDFSIKPGVPNYYGLIGAEANAIAPGKRMLSAMTPTIVEKEGKFFMSAGSPGGPTIITSVFQVILNVIEFDMAASEAVAMKRFHHQWLPDEITYEEDCFSSTLSDSLKAKGHHLKEVKRIGSVEVIHRLPDGSYEGAADPRESSHASGVYK